MSIGLCVSVGYVLPLSCLFSHLTSYLIDGLKMPRQKYIRGLVLGQTHKIHSEIEPTPPLI